MKLDKIKQNLKREFFANLRGYSKVSNSEMVLALYAFPIFQSKHFQ